MADPKLGNRSEEMAQFEQGADFEGINSSTLPEAGPVLEVQVQRVGDDLQLVRKRVSAARTLELRHSETDLLAAQLTEDSEMTGFSVPNVGKIEASPSRLSKALSRNSNREQLIWFGLDAQNMTAAMGDRIVVRRDALESEYICRSCKGKGHTSEVCKNCEGKQQRNGVQCTGCKVLGFEAETSRPSGFTRCVDCSGSGWKHGIVIPEASQGKPVTGTVVSLGPDTQLVKLGDRVLHSKFAGHTLEMKQETYTFMREGEVISLLRDLM